jgi:hypothetical protein
MLLTIAIVLAVLWLLGVVAFHVTAGFIHLLIVVALVVFIWDVVTRNRTRP